MLMGCAAGGFQMGSEYRAILQRYRLEAMEE